MSGAGWQWVPLESVAHIVNGGTPASQVPEYWNGDVWWLTPKDMGKLQHREVDRTPRTLTQDGLRSSSARLVPTGSIILSTRAPIGHLAINLQPMAFNQGCRGIVPSQRIDRVFLYYFLLLNRATLDDLGTGATFKELSAGALRSFEVPVPPLDEQKRIVAALDQAFAALDRAAQNTRQDLDDLGDVMRRQLSLVFFESEWPQKSIAEVCVEIFAGGDVPKERHSKQPTERYKVPIYTNGERNKGLYGYTDTPRVTTPSLTISARGTIGHTEIRHDAYFPAIRLIVLEPNNAVIDLGYLYHAVQCLDVDHSGSSIPQLTVPMIRELEIPVPPLALQREVSLRLERLASHVSDLRSCFEQKLADIAELRQSLLEAAFSGQLS